MCHIQNKDYYLPHIQQNPAWLWQYIQFSFSSLGPEYKRAAKSSLVERSNEKVYKMRKIKGKFYQREHYGFYSYDNEPNSHSTIKLVVYAH